MNFLDIRSHEKTSAIMALISTIMIFFILVAAPSIKIEDLLSMFSAFYLLFWIALLLSGLVTALLIRDIINLKNRTVSLSIFGVTNVIYFYYLVIKFRPMMSALNKGAKFLKKPEEMMDSLDYMEELYTLSKASDSVITVLLIFVIIVAVMSILYLLRKLKFEKSIPNTEIN